MIYVWLLAPPSHAHLPITPSIFIRWINRLSKDVAYYMNEKAQFEAKYQTLTENGANRHELNRQVRLSSVSPLPSSSLLFCIAGSLCLCLRVFGLLRTHRTIAIICISCRRIYAYAHICLHVYIYTNEYMLRYTYIQISQDTIRVHKYTPVRVYMYAYICICISVHTQRDFINETVATLEDTRLRFEAAHKELVNAVENFILGDCEELTKAEVCVRVYLQKHVHAYTCAYMYMYTCMRICVCITWMSVYG